MNFLRVNEIGTFSAAVESCRLQMSRKRGKILPGPHKPHRPKLQVRVQVQRCTVRKKTVKKFIIISMATRDTL
jgi:hypothetical protein